MEGCSRFTWGKVMTWFSISVDEQNLEMLTARELKDRNVMKVMSLYGVGAIWDSFKIL